MVSRYRGVFDAQRVKLERQALKEVDRFQAQLGKDSGWVSLMEVSG
jgi:hypothetical protein